MPASTTPLDTITETEKLAAVRMKWWGVYLVREQRRLQGIADRVNAQATARAVGHPPIPTLPDPTAFQKAIDPSDPGPSAAGGETPEAMLVRLDARIAEQEAAAELEAEEAETTLAAQPEPVEIIPPAQGADPSPAGKDISPSPLALGPEVPPHREGQAPGPAGKPDDAGLHEKIVTGKASMLGDFSNQDQAY